MVRPVFRSMISMATTASQRDPIVLTDPNVEHSLVVKEVLDIIYNHQVDALSVYAWANLYLYVVEFAKKWEMSMITDFIRKELSMDMKDDNHAFRAFDFLLVALNLGDNSLAAQCYEAMRSESWAAYDPRHVDGEVGFASDDQPYAADKSEFEEEDGLPIQYLDDSPAFKLTDNNPLAVTPNSCFGHLGAMPYSWFLRLPPTVAWIIHRANTHYQFGLGSGKDIFKELLDLECESSSSDTWQTAADNRSTSQALKVQQLESSRG